MSATHVSGVEPTFSGPVYLLPTGYPRERPQLVVPAATNQWIAQVRRELDELSWRQAADALDATARSGKLHKKTAAHIAAAIRAGLNGNLPPSWVPASYRGVLPQLHSASFAREPSAVAYALAAPFGSSPKGDTPYLRATRRGYISDNNPRQTIMKHYGFKSETTWENWYKPPANIAAAEFILDLVALEFVSILGTPLGEEMIRRRLLGE